MVNKLRHVPHFLIGFCATGLAIYFLTAGSKSLSLCIATLFLAAICLADTLSSKIPNLFTLSLLALGCAYHIMLFGVIGILWCLLGALTGLALLFPVYALSGMGAGDVKALAALGGLLGAGAILQVFLYMGLIGGLLAAIYMICDYNQWERVGRLLRNLRDALFLRDIKGMFTALLPSKETSSLQQNRFPYAAAIAFGYLAYEHWGGLI